MFRCQYSGEISDPVEYGFFERPSLDDPNKTERVYGVVKAAEKPVKVVVEYRRRDYSHSYKDEEGDLQFYKTKGTEIAKEIMIRAKYLDKFK